MRAQRQITRRRVVGIAIRNSPGSRRRRQAALAYGGNRLSRRPPSPERTLALSMWGLNQAAIAGWSEIFFGLRAPRAGTIAAGAIVGTAAGYVATAAREDEQAAAAGFPLLLWVSFTTLLAKEIWRRNDQG